MRRHLGATLVAQIASSLLVSAQDAASPVDALLQQARSASTAKDIPGIQTAVRQALDLLDDQDRDHTDATAMGKRWDCGTIAGIDDALALRVWDGVLAYYRQLMSPDVDSCRWQYQALDLRRRVHERQGSRAAADADLLSRDQLGSKAIELLERTDPKCTDPTAVGQRWRLAEVLSGIDVERGARLWDGVLAYYEQLRSPDAVGLSWHLQALEKRQALHEQQRQSEAARSCQRLRKEVGGRALELLDRTDPRCTDEAAMQLRREFGTRLYGVDSASAARAWQGVLDFYGRDGKEPPREQLPALQQARSLRADLHERQRQYDQAIALREVIVKAWEAASRPREASEQQIYLGQAMVQSGVYQQGVDGLALMERAAAALRGKAENADWARAAHLYTIALVDMARLLDDRVIALQQQVLAYYRAHPPEPAELVNLLWETANVLQDRGELLAARLLAQESLDRAVQSYGKDDLRTFYPRAFYGNLLKNMGDMDQALLLCNANRELCERVGLPARDTTRMRAWNNLGHTCLVLDRFEDAVAAFAKGLEACDPEDRDPLVANNRAYIFDNLGECLAELGRFDEAKQKLEQALAMDLTPVQRAIIEGGKAMVLQRAGDLEEAARWFDRCIDRVVQTQARRQPVKYLRRQALVLHALDRKDKVPLTKCLQTLLDVAGRALGECHTLPGRPSYQLATVADDAARTVLSLADKATDPPALERQAFEVLESLRGIELRTTHLATRLLSSPEFTAQRDKARAARTELGKLAALGAGDAGELLEKAIQRERAEFEALFQSYEQLAKQPLRLTVDALAAQLPKGAAIVAYRVLPIIEPDPAKKGFDREELRFEAHVVTKEGKQGRLQRVPLGPAAAIQTTAENWRQAIEGGEVRGRGSPPAGPDHAAELSRLILVPLKEKLGANKILIVCLDDVLCTVPIELMPDAEKAGYEFRFTVALGDLVGKPAAPAVDSMLAVGGLDFDHKPGETPAPTGPRPGAGAEDTRGLSESKVTDSPFTPLGASKPEAQYALQVFQAKSGKTGKLLTGTDAAQQTFGDSLAGVRFLHLATHGYFLRPSEDTLRYETVSRLAPMSLCGLALSGANETDEDFVGVISGEEIAARDLSGCELAVLSACETVHGTSRAGHGLASLQGAFHAAGARFVIATRWKIPDERSRELMSTFYAQLWHKKEPKSPRQALDHAKEELRKKKAPVQHWAGFVLTGDPR